MDTTFQVKGGVKGRTSGKCRKQNRKTCFSKRWRWLVHGRDVSEKGSTFCAHGVSSVLENPVVIVRLCRFAFVNLGENDKIFDCMAKYRSDSKLDLADPNS